MVEVSEGGRKRNALELALKKHQEARTAQPNSGSGVLGVRNEATST